MEVVKQFGLQANRETKNKALVKGNYTLSKEMKWANQVNRFSDNN
jgi:hypothetical protein